MSLVAFTLRAEHAETYGGGQLAYGPDGLTFDVGQAFEEGDGKIVTDDPLLIAALENLDGGDGPLLKRTTVGDSPTITPLPDGATGVVESGHSPGLSAAAAGVDEAQLTEKERELLEQNEAAAASHDTDNEGYSGLTVSELQEELKKRKVAFKKDETKPDLVQKLEADDDAKEASA